LNINILTLSEVQDIKGEKGNFDVEILKHPRYVDMEKCIACGTCFEKCPKKVDDEYNENLIKRKAIYVPYSQAVPLKYVIDREACIYFKKGKCRACEKFCPTEAIKFDEKEETTTLKVGSVILAPGFQTFDPTRYEALHYGKHPNVVTSLEFERMLSSTGPNLGHLKRPSDDKEPKKIAWLQCVGSRDINRCDNSYCSAVCCMYAIKQAVISKEHSDDPLDAAIFFMDMRTFGKDYELYYNKAKEDYGVRFIRSRVPAIDPDPENNDLIIRYSDEGGVTHKEKFDMVVLSVGLEISKETVQFAKGLGISLDDHSFAATHPLKPAHTSVPGIYASGLFTGPKDIPYAVIEASAAACAASMDISDARGTEVETKATPEERNVAEEDPRIGVFVCNCGTNIGGVVDVPHVADYAATLPRVVHVDQNLFSCSQDTQEKIKEVITENRLNRIVVAACSPKTHEPLFQETIQACGLNRYLFEMANIRNQDSWVHGDDHAAATEKAKDLVRMAVARASLLKPLTGKTILVNKRALVIGGGVSGMTAALGLAEQGFEVVIVEKEPRLGGLALEIERTIEGADVKDFLQELIVRMNRHPRIQVLTESLIVGFSGFKGNFTTEVLVGPGMYERKIVHGAAILATGANEYAPKEFLYGENEQVLTQIQLSKRLHEQGAAGLAHLAMIQCVGSRNEESPNCSRICCQNAIKNALHVKKLNPDTQVYIFYRDIRTYGILEDYYREARRLGVRFFRYDRDAPPRVESMDHGLVLTFRDHVLQRDIRLPVDILALSAGLRAEDTEELSSILKLGRNHDGYFTEAHVKLRPVEMASEGIFVCGTAHGPKLISESLSQAMAAASRAATFLSQAEITLPVVTAKVDQEKCASCLVCVRSCPYDVPRINEEGVSDIDEALCHGCGICASECPAKVIELNLYEDDQILSKVEALLEGVI
jgi:heterodisulfide reductase subunit A